ncbi:xanthine dehydrogenase family protein molybdopterin-binding subunit [Litorisediminicola beolgyonensis]|uniref:Xanthine dehydrogenase family protein molybdopterin-binding subunit n=1 Tax=Litorisediminicola beolgyonensis TaxID=1173614 RepID=A0ABW3ZKE2_9RHOB
MTRLFRMNEAQPRVLDETNQGIIGAPEDRPEGRLKVSGQATYAAEVPHENMAHGVLIRATITRGTVTGIDSKAAMGMDGVLGVYALDRFLRNPAQGMSGEAPEQPGARVDYLGQPIGVVVAETFEAARHAAQTIAVSYDETPGAEVDPATASEVEVDHEEHGDLDAVWSEAAATVDKVYHTAAHVAAAMEPHASIAEWDGDRITLHSPLQLIRFNKRELADSLGIPAENVRILAPYIGGGFGSKLGLSPDAVAAAVAARDLGRPVRVVMSRQHVMDSVLRRSETRQRLCLAADADGRLLGLSHEDLVSNLPGEGFSEPTAQATHFLYAGTHRRYRQEVARIHRTPAGSVRAPGEAVGMMGLETAMDELAETLGLDPLELRLRNIPESHPEEDKEFTANSLGECLRRGAEAFGWSERKGPGERAEGDWLIGMGCASAARASSIVASEARVTLTAEGALVETDMTDIGTGTYAILAQIAAEMLGLLPSQVQVRLGDSDLPPAAGSGGSFGALSSGSSVFIACQGIRETIAAKMDGAAEDLTLTEGKARLGNREVPFSDLIDTPLTETGRIESGDTGKTHIAAAFGAHFAEVAVHRWTGEVRVRRFHAEMSAGRILNEKTARSQVIGGVIWGIGTALTEEAAHEPRMGHIVGRDLANYHVPAHLDVPQITVGFVEERADHANPIQAKGIGELGISGAGAAITNAIANACGARVRRFPATPDVVIDAMPLD